MTTTSTATALAGAELAEELMELGSELPLTLAQMDYMQRFAAVGVLYSSGYIPSHEIATALLFRPEHVLMVPTEVFEQGLDQIAQEISADTVSDEPLAQWERDLLAGNVPTVGDVARELTETGSVEYPVAPAPEDPEMAMLDDAIYGSAERLIKLGAPEDFIANLLGLVGLDWPRGSGDFHGGKPFAEMGPEDVPAARAAVHRMYAEAGMDDLLHDEETTTHRAVGL